MENAELLERLQKLERGQRRSRVVGGLALLLLVVAIALGAEKVEKMMEGEELVIRDKAGNERIKMAVDDTGPYLRMFDSKGHPRAVLLVEDDGATFVLPGGIGLRSNLMFSNRNEPAFYITDAQGKIRCELSTKTGTARLIMTDPDQKEAVVIAAAKDGPSFSLYDNQKKLRALISVFGGISRFGLLDPRQAQRVMLTAAAEGSSMAVNDENEIRRAAILTATGQGTAIATFNKYGDMIWNATGSTESATQKKGAPGAPGAATPPSSDAGAAPGTVPPGR
jgi:hypothetical protein